MVDKKLKIFYHRENENSEDIIVGTDGQEYSLDEFEEVYKQSEIWPSLSCI